MSLSLFAYRARPGIGRVLSRTLVVAGAVSLAACASISLDARHPPAAGIQPLQRIAVAPDVASRDELAELIAGELALSDAQIDVAAQHYAEAARHSDDPAISEQATRVALAGRQWDLAHTALARWETLRGDESNLHQARAILALHDGAADAAFANLSWLAHQPDGAGWRAITQALLGAEDKSRAGAMLERLLANISASKLASSDANQLGSKPETWIAVSQLALRLQRKDLAQALATRAVMRFHVAETYAWAAQLRLGEGDKTGARQLFADALRNDKQVGDGALGLRVAYAKLLGDLGDNVPAAQVLAQGKQNDYTYAARAGYLARAADDKSVKAQIERLYAEVLALPLPRLPARVQLLGQLAELLERKPEAMKWYAQVSVGDEHWFAAQVRTAVLLDGTGNTGAALDLLHELEASSGDDGREVGDAFMLEAELLNKHKRGEEAVAVYDRGLQALPDDTRLIYSRALLNDDLDHVDAAVRDLRRVLELKPDDADAMNALGYTLADRTDAKAEALALIEKALLLKPGEPAIIDSLGWVQYRLGHLDAALAQLRIAYQKQPDPEIAAHLGEVLWVSGNQNEARKIWELGRKKDGANKVLLETIKRLAS